MTITTKTLKDFVAGQIAAVQGAVNGIIDFSIGSILLSLIESNSSVATYLQQLIVRLLARTRAATSTGDDLDSWVSDYGFHPPRFGAGSSIGSLTFSRFTGTATATIPVGTLAQTASGEKFEVVADTSNPAYSAISASYTLGVGITTITVPAKSTSSGNGVNALANTIIQISQALPGIDTVTNLAAFSGGATGETDEALRARFVLWVSSLSKGTMSAILYATKSFSASIDVYPVENYDYNGNPKPGYFYLVVYNKGAVDSTGINTIMGLVDAVRGLAITFGVFNAVEVTANLSISLSLNGGFLLGDVSGVVSNAVTAYMSSIKISQTLSYPKMISLILNASPGIADVTSLTINGTSSNLTATSKQVIKLGTLAIA